MLPIFLYINPYICYTRSEIRLLTKEVLAIIDMLRQRVLDLIHDPSYKPLKRDELAKIFVEHRDDKKAPRPDERGRRPLYKYKEKGG